MTRWAVQAEGLTKTYGTVRALDGLDLEIAPGTVTGLLGPNGAGKTTAVRVLATLLSALQQRGLKRGVASLCIGGGEATAMAVELV